LRGLRSIADLPGLVLATIADAIRSARTRAREVGSLVSTSLFGGAKEATDTDATVDAQIGARERIRRAFESVIDASPMYRTRVATATPETSPGARPTPGHPVNRSRRSPTRSATWSTATAIRTPTSSEPRPHTIGSATRLNRPTKPMVVGVTRRVIPMSRSPSTTGLAIVTGLAAALLAVGATVIVQPALLLERVPELEAVLSALDPALVVLAMALVLVVFAPTLGIAGRLRSSATSPLVEPTAGSGLDPSRFDDRATRQRIVGESFDRWLELATAYDDESRSTREDARRRLVESLRPIAATAYANRAGLTEDDAMAAIEAGSWTDDPARPPSLGARTVRRRRCGCGCSIS